MKCNLALFLLVCFVSFGSITKAQNIIEWRGPNRSGIYAEIGLLNVWPAEGPKLLWAADGLPKGFSSACVTPVGVFLTGIVDSTDVLIALDKSGQLKWKTPYGRYWKASFSDSRCTPTFENNKLYVSSGYGDIACIDATNGKIIWQLKASEKFGGTYGEWGIAESLLINGDQLYFTPGGPKTTMVAINKNTGETIWTSESINDNPAYVSPLLIDKDGKKLIIGLTELYVFAVNPDNGKLLWKENYYNIKSADCIKIWDGAPKINTITPLYNNGNLYITKGYNHVGVMFKLSDDGSKATIAWTDSLLDCHHGGVVLVNGFIYGSNWIDNGNGNWCCIDWNTGKKMYETAWNCKGSMISADGMLYCYDEKKGNVGLVKPNPEKFDLVSSFKVPKGTGPHWAHPVISDGILYIRHGNALMAYDVKKQTL